MNKLIVILAFTTASTLTYAETNFSGELLIGSSDQTTEVLDISLSGEDISYGIRGSYLFNQYIEAELSYQDYGTAEDSYDDGFGTTLFAEIKTSAFTLGVKGVLPLDGSFSLNARAGFAKWDYDIVETVEFFPEIEFANDDQGTDLYYGLGAQYDINNSIFVGIEYFRTEMDVSFDEFSIDHEVNNISLSLGTVF